MCCSHTASIGMDCYQLSSLMKKPHNGSSRSVMPLFHERRSAWPFVNFMSSTKKRSNATKMCWMKKTTDAISDTARKESVQVVLLQTYGENGLIWSTLRWSLNDFSSVQFSFFERERSTNFVSNAFIVRHSTREIFLRVFVHVDTDSFNSINSELWVTKPFKILFETSSSQIMGNSVFIWSSIFPWHLPWSRPFLMI